VDATLAARLHRLTEACRRAQDTAAAAREARDAAVEDADGEGHSVREIARQSGLSASRVHDIVLARAAARQQRLAEHAGLA